MHNLETTVQADATAVLCACPTCPPSSTPCAPMSQRSDFFHLFDKPGFYPAYPASYPCLKRKHEAAILHLLYQTTEESFNIRILFQRGIKPLLPSQWVTTLVAFVGTP